MDNANKKCVGCGYCCWKATCSIGMQLGLGNEHGACQGLIWSKEAGRHYCKILLLPDGVADKQKDQLRQNIGTGCGSSLLNDWRDIIKDRTKETKDSYYKNPLTKEFQMFLKSLSRQMISGDVIALTISDFKNSLKKEGEHSEIDILRFTSEIVHLLKQQRSSFMEKFLG